MFTDDIQVRMGLDRRPFDKALSGAKSAMATFKGALGAIGASFSLGALKGFLSGIFNMANDLKRTSKALDVSTDFLQEWQIAVGEAGGDAKNAGAQLEKFTQRLAASGKSGSDIEFELRRVADAMAAQPDPIKRAKIAFDAFGKGAAELIPLLSGGSKALDEFRSRAKLSAADIERLDKAQDNLTEAQRNMQVSTGTASGFLLKLSSAMGTAAGKMGLLSTVTGYWAQVVHDMDASDIEDALATVAAKKARADQKAVITATKLAEKQAAVGAAYLDAHDAQVKADFDAMTDAQKLNVLLEYRLKLLRELAADNTRSIPNAKKLGALPGLTTDINKLRDEVGPGETGAPGTLAETARDRAVAANPRLAAMLAEQDRRSGMSARDLAIDASPRMGDFLGNHPGPKMKDPNSPGERTATAVEKLLEKEETVGLKIRPTNSE